MNIREIFEEIEKNKENLREPDFEIYWSDGIIYISTSRHEEYYAVKTTDIIQIIRIIICYSLTTGIKLFDSTVDLQIKNVLKKIFKRNKLRLRGNNE